MSDHFQLLPQDLKVEVDHLVHKGKYAEVMIELNDDTYTLRKELNKITTERIYNPGNMMSFLPIEEYRIGLELDSPHPEWLLMHKTDPPTSINLVQKREISEIVIKIDRLLQIHSFKTPKIRKDLQNVIEMLNKIGKEIVE
jgi:hypothetical protein